MNRLRQYLAVAVILALAWEHLPRPVWSQIAGTPMPMMTPERLATETQERAAATPTPTGSPAATEVAPAIIVAGTALVSDLIQANDNPAVIIEREATAVSDYATTGVTGLSSDNPAAGGAAGQGTGRDADSEAGSWAAGTSLGGGLLLVIVALFFFLSRKRTAGRG
jgi:hypothetical protein